MVSPLLIIKYEVYVVIIIRGNLTLANYSKVRGKNKTENVFENLKRDFNVESSIYVAWYLRILIRARLPIYFYSD